MTLPFAGFPLSTFKAMGTAPLVLATIRAECDRQGRCFKDQRYLADKAGLPPSTFNWHVGQFKKRGVIALVYRGRRQSAVIVILPEHRWVTPEKPAPAGSECPTQLDTSSKATLEKDPPVAPASGGDAPVFEKSAEGGAGIEAEVPKVSHRRTPYGQPRAPRRPRAPRQRQRGAENAAACDIAIEKLIAKKFGPAAAKRVNAAPPVPPPPETALPDHQTPLVIDEAGNVIPFTPRPSPPRQRRGFSPATDNARACHHAIEKLIAKRFPRDSGDRYDLAQPLLAAGRSA